MLVHVGKKKKIAIPRQLLMYLGDILFMAEKLHDVDQKSLRCQKRQQTRAEIF